MPPVRRGAVDLSPAEHRPPPPKQSGLMVPRYGTRSGDVAASTADGLSGAGLAHALRAEDDYRSRAADLHPENRPPIVRLRLTERVIDPLGWLEVRPYLVSWCQAGAAWLELDGSRFPPANLARVGDVRDLYGTHLVFVDVELAQDALSVLRPAKAAGAL